MFIILSFNILHTQRYFIGHIYSIRGNLISAFNLSLRSSGQPQHSTAPRDQLQILCQYHGQGYRLEKHPTPNMHPPWGVKAEPEDLEESHAKTVHANSTERLCSSQESNPGPPYSRKWFIITVKKVVTELLHLCEELVFGCRTR